MATIMHQGGWMMWPLLALSLVAVAVICERMMFYGGLGFPAAGQNGTLAAALANRDITILQAALPVSHPVLGGYFGELDRFIRSGEGAGRAEAHGVLDIFAEEIAGRLDRRLPLLGVIVRAAPLMGLLGTVLGMINTFSRLAATQGGVDLMTLADGIWQALITTATGLVIAIPALLAQYWFISRKRRVLDALYRLSASVFALADTAEEGGHGA